MLSVAFIVRLSPPNAKSQFSAVFANWHAFCDTSDIRRNGPPIMKEGIDHMELLNSKAAAAVFSLAFSLVMFATAIAPANGGALLPGGMLA